MEKVIDDTDALVLLDKFADVSAASVLRGILFSLILRGVITEEDLQLAMANQDSFYLKDRLP
jgi:hypothetical protein